ncbi:hypothetical protein [Pararobbsia silviterrae]|nr:hypothetical protein [Pararobbsia silviterrae]
MNLHRLKIMPGFGIDFIDAVDKALSAIFFAGEAELKVLISVRRCRPPEPRLSPVYSKKSVPFGLTNVVSLVIFALENRLKIA